MNTDSKQRVVAHVAPIVPAEAPVPPAPHAVKRTIRKKRHVCEHPGCGQAFESPYHLAKRNRVHTGDRPYVCEDCGASFAQCGNLNAHKRLHSGDRPYICEECGATFKQNNRLTVHKLIHTGQKPYVCEECGATFAQNGNLAKHKLTHTGQKPYVCEDCAATFARNDSLAKHKLTHTGQKPYICEDCGVSFAQRSTLARHKRAIHTARGQQRQKKKEERVSRFLIDAGLTFERGVVVNFCGEAERRHARVDFTIYRDWGTDVVECDEEQHFTIPLAATPGECSTSSQRS